MSRYMRAMSCSGRVQARAGQYLEETDLQSLPTIFAEQAWSDCSENFRVIPTIHVLRGLEQEGFVPTFAQAAKSRIPGKVDFTRHMIRLRHRDHLTATATDLAPELILLNANDRTSSYQLRGGIIKFLCLNGLWTCDEMAAPVRVPHKGNADAIRDKVIEGTYTLIESVSEATDRTADYRGIALNHDERRLLSQAAINLRWDDPERDPATLPVTPEMALLPRRAEEQSGDLLTIYNVVQENLTRGTQGAFGANNWRLRRMVRDSNNRSRMASVREMTGIDQQSTFGRALAGLVEGMAVLKSGGSVTFA